MFGPALWLALALAWVGSLGGAFWYGTNVGEDHITAQQARDDRTVKETREAAQQGAADAISKITITNTTIRQQAETVVRERVIYGDCRHVDGMRDRINEALTGRPQPAGGGKLPRADASGR